MKWSHSPSGGQFNSLRTLTKNCADRFCSGTAGAAKHVGAGPTYKSITSSREANWEMTLSKTSLHFAQSATLACIQQSTE
jgi:hypothetical protein